MVMSAARSGVRDVRVRTRLLRGRSHPLPDFIIIGGQRCGTTSLYQDLRRHPQVREPLGKELQYFTLHYHRGLDWYRAHFPLLEEGQQTFEASPYYLFNEQAPSRASSDLPHAKFIALLRDPVERAYSHYLHTRRAGAEPLSFADALEAEPERLARARAAGPESATGQRILRQYSYVSRGMYGEQLERWSGCVGHDRLHIIRSEDLHSDPVTHFSELLAFLDLEDFRPPSYAQHSLRSPAERTGVPPGIKDRLQGVFEDDAARVLRLTGWTHAW
jgi:hypothetical protein